MEENLRARPEEWCAREMVQNIGSIQPHGVLFSLCEPELSITQVSANAVDFLEMPVDLILGRCFKEVLGSDQFATLYESINSSSMPIGGPFPVCLGPSGMRMHCFAHRHDGMLILEMELLEGAFSLELLNLNAHVRVPLTRLNLARSIVDLSQVAAAEIRRLSAFDRVMIYRFDDACDGEVIAEVCDPLPRRYLGLRFPAGDIPPQVRELFLKNSLRTIADVAAPPVPLLSLTEDKPLDMTYSLLRCAAPVHLEYLRNMGVCSSLTVSVIIKQQLWGIIACHSAKPHRVDWTARSICELIGQVFASQLSLRMDNFTLKDRLYSRKLLEKYMAEVEACASPEDASYLQNSHLLEVLDADGSVARIRGVVTSWGATVKETLLLPVIEKLRKDADASRGIAASHSLQSLDASAVAYAGTASGALYIGLMEQPGDCLLLLRKELVETVKWAGNPDKGASVDSQGRMQPRTSFAEWQQTVRGRSRLWTKLELENAGVLREHMLRVQAAQHVRLMQERVQHVADVAAHDTLTGLVNRHSIHSQVEDCIRQAKADSSSFSVLFIDLDHFKYCNDSLGHAAGDSILQIVATRMQHHTRALDIVGRLGGDEFIIILPGLHLEGEVLELATRILRAIEEPIKLDQNAPVNITASIGMSRYPKDGLTVEALFGDADFAMYKAKRSGGNALQVFRGGHTPPTKA